MRYSTLDGERVLAQATTTYEWWIVSASALATELADAGLTVDHQPDTYGDDLVVARA